MASVTITFTDSMLDGEPAVDISATVSAEMDTLENPITSPALVVGTYLRTMARDDRILQLAMDAAALPGFRKVVMQSFHR